MFQICSGTLYFVVYISTSAESNALLTKERRSRLIRLVKERVFEAPDIIEVPVPLVGLLVSLLPVLDITVPGVVTSGFEVPAVSGAKVSAVLGAEVLVISDIEDPVVSVAEVPVILDAELPALFSVEPPEI